jgi:hypothetical protein
MNDLQGMCLMKSTEKEKFFLWVGVFEVERYLGRGFEVERCNSEVELLSTNYSKTNVVLR